MEPALKTVALICVAASCLFTACDSDFILSASTFTVGGTVSGLTGSGLVLQYVSGNVSSSLTISSNGKFLYTLNTGNGTIGVFAIHKDGSLTNLGSADGIVAAGGFNGIAAN